MYKIIICSSSKKSIDLYFNFLILVLNKLNVTFFVFNLPTDKKRIALLKSPHVYKKSKEHFEIRKYKSVILIDFRVDLKMLKLLLLNKPKSVILKLHF
jgi:ribosomal protein S10